MRSRSWGEFSSSFIGRHDIRTWAQAKAAAQGLWPKGNEIVEGMLDELKHVELPKPKSRKRRRRYSDENGDEVDYDRLRLGQPFWRTSRREHAGGEQFVTLVVDLCAACSVKADKILWRGAAAVLLTHLLEEAGYRVELWGTFRTEGIYTDRKNGAEDMFTAVRLKRPEEMLDMQSLTIAVSGWFFRTVAFRSFVVDTRKTCPSLGIPRLPKPKDIAEITSDENHRLIADVWDRTAAIELVKQTIEMIDTRSVSETK